MPNILSAFADKHPYWTYAILGALIIIVVILLIVVITKWKAIRGSGFLVQGPDGKAMYIPDTDQSSGNQTTTAFATALGSPGLEGVSAVNTPSLRVSRAFVPCDESKKKDSRINLLNRSTVVGGMPITADRQAVLTRWGTDSVDAGLNCGNMTATLNPDGTLKKMSSKWDYDAAAQAYSLMNMGVLPRGINYMDRVMYQNLNQVKDQVLKDMDASAPVIASSTESPLEQLGAQ